LCLVNNPLIKNKEYKYKATQLLNNIKFLEDSSNFLEDYDEKNLNDPYEIDVLIYSLKKLKTLNDCKSKNVYSKLTSTE